MLVVITAVDGPRMTKNDAALNHQSRCLPPLYARPPPSAKSKTRLFAFHPRALHPVLPRRGPNLASPSTPLCQKSPPNPTHRHQYHLSNSSTLRSVTSCPVAAGGETGRILCRLQTGRGSVRLTAWCWGVPGARVSHRVGELCCRGLDARNGRLPVQDEDSPANRPLRGRLGF